MNAILLHCITSTLTRYVESTPSTYNTIWPSYAKDLRHLTPRTRTGCELKTACAFYLSLYYWYRIPTKIIILLLLLLLLSLQHSCIVIVAVWQFFDATHGSRNSCTSPTRPVSVIITYVANRVTHAFLIVLIHYLFK